MNKDTQTLSVILAGGKASRFGGGQKALQTLAGKTLLEYTFASWRQFNLPEAFLAINARHSAKQLRQFGYPVFPDRECDIKGPLLGLLSALHRAKELNSKQNTAISRVLILPCDTPFFPANLFTRLSAVPEDIAAVSSYAGQLQPVFSLWPLAMLPKLESTVFDSGLYGFKQLLKVTPHQICEWEETDALSFFNINSKTELQKVACQLLQNHASFGQAVNHGCHSLPKI